jgi:hypothetical protein
MKTGFFASVAALAASAGMAFGQGGPGAPSAAPTSYPGFGTAVMGAPAGPAPGGPPPGQLTGYPMGIPPAGPADQPHIGVQQNGPQVFDPWNTSPKYDPYTGHDGHPVGPGGPGQIHKAAGGPDRWYIDLEWLVWYPKSAPVAFPLVTAGPAGSLGVLGTEGTRVLFGDKRLDYGDTFNVFRLTVGCWDRPRVWGYEAVGFIQETRSQFADFIAPLDAREVLARPAIDAITGLPTAVLIGFPGVFAGEVQPRATLKMGGAELNLLRALVYCDRFKLNFLAGVRYIDHDENLQVFSRTTVPSNAFDPTVPPDVIEIFDEFAVRNQFFGGQLGLQTELRRGRWFADVIGKVALGNMNEQLDVIGVTTSNIAGVVTRVDGGLLALVSNIGRRDRDEFAFVPELTLKFGYQWTQRISTYIGYNMLYLSNVLRPGDQIDPVINPTLLPVSAEFGNIFGPPRPQVVFNESDFWTQGVTFGLSIRY